jgi:cytochrome c oxidase assembly protein subunit 15
MSANKGFRRFTRITIFFTIFVVFAGSMVKVTGSGMGCPDWPKCFGYIIPPFSEEQLDWKPNFDYHKGEMIIVGDSLFVAEQDFQTSTNFNNSNWSIYSKHDYHEYKPIHTIIEYVNRLVSVLLGGGVLLMIFFSFKSTQLKALNIILAFTTLFLIGFEAWLGKLVVDGVLNPTDISFHMLVAFLIVLVLSFTHVKNNTEAGFQYPKKYQYIQIAAFTYLMYQLIMGVVLRQTFDTFSDISRERWVDEAGISFLIHRSSSLIYVALTILTWRILKEVPKDTFERKNFRWVVILTVGEIVSGAIMGYLEVPKAAQPFHVIVSSILLLVQANLFFKIITKKQY